MFYIQSGNKESQIFKFLPSAFETGLIISKLSFYFGVEL